MATQRKVQLKNFAKQNSSKQNSSGKKAAKTAVHKHERNMHPGKPLTKLSNDNNNGKKK